MEGGVNPSQLTSRQGVSACACECACARVVLLGPADGPHDLGAVLFLGTSGGFLSGRLEEPRRRDCPSHARALPGPPVSVAWPAALLQEEQVRCGWHGHAASGGVWVATCSARAPKRPSSAPARGPLRTCWSMPGADGGCHAFLARVRGARHHHEVAVSPASQRRDDG